MPKICSSSIWLVAVLLAIVIFHSPTTTAFCVPVTTKALTTSQTLRRNMSKNPAEELFENFKRLWLGKNNNNDNDDNTTSKMRGSSFFSGTNDDDNKNYQVLSSDDVAAGTTLITSIPVSSIKPGGLRLFLMFYLMGMQNTPDPHSWRADQPSTDEYLVELLYCDQSAMISVELKQEEICICRVGSVPSMAYLLQESVIVDGILEELEQCANEANVADADKLLIPNPSDAIARARGALTFG